MSFLTLLPSILLSGFVFPFDGMPPLARAIAQVLPLTHFVEMIRGILLRGAPLAEMQRAGVQARRVPRRRARHRDAALPQAARLSIEPRVDESATCRLKDAATAGGPVRCRPPSLERQTRARGTAPDSPTRATAHAAAGAWSGMSWRARVCLSKRDRTYRTQRQRSSRRPREGDCPTSARQHVLARRVADRPVTGRTHLRRRHLRLRRMLCQPRGERRPPRAGRRLHLLQVLRGRGQPPAGFSVSTRWRRRGCTGPLMMPALWPPLVRQNV